MSQAEPYGVGLQHVGSYQVSGKPYLSGAAGVTTTASSRFQFDTVTKSIRVRNTGGTNSLYLAFAPSGSGEFPADYSNGSGDSKNFILIKAGEEVNLNVKCREIFVYSAAGTTDVAVYAELTHIPSARMFSLDGLAGVTS
jgi:hypothetical protein